MEMQIDKTCDVTPDISVMKKMASMNGTIASRIMELVDNAIDAKIEGKPLRIDINVVKTEEHQHIEIVDNGCGMTEEVAKGFFRLGDSQKEGKNKIGRFGFGSKVAILGLGDTCFIETVPVNEDYMVKFYFDIHRFKQWNVPYQIVNKRKKQTHGTKIRIENITSRIGSLDRFCDRLTEQFAKVYKHFLTEDVTIRINGKEIKPHTADLLPGFYQEFDFEVDGKRVYGWCGAKKETGSNWKFGFDLISNGRTIKQNDFLTRVAHQSLSRLTGEIHLDEFETDIHKTDFIRHHPSFEKMQEKLLNEEIADMITKISKMSNKEVFEKYQQNMKQVSNVLNKVLNSFDFLNQLDIEEGIFKKIKAKKREPVVATMVEVNDEELPKDEVLENQVEDNQDEQDEQEEKEVKPPKPRKNKMQSGLIIEEPVGVSAGYEQPPRQWAITESGDAIRLSIEVNVDHPSYTQLDDNKVTVQMQNAVLDSVAEFILDEEKKHSGFVESEIERLNQLKDMLVRCSLAV